MSELNQDHDLKAIAEALGMSTRWVRQQIANGAEYIRYGNRIRMTTEQVEKLRAKHTANATTIPTSITTGRKRAAR